MWRGQWICMGVLGIVADWMRWMQHMSHPCDARPMPYHMPSTLHEWRALGATL